MRGLLGSGVTALFELAALEPISAGHAHMVRALPTGLLGRAQSPTEIAS